MTGVAILAVCSGNICRSPLAEQLLRAQLGDRSGVTFQSSGTMAIVGDSMDDRAAHYSRQLGGDPSQHRARQLTIDQVTDADLVLAMSRDHRKAIVQLLPRAARHTFTLRELAHILAATEQDVLNAAAPVPETDFAGRFAAVVETAAANRGTVVPPDYAEDYDIVDPYGRTDEVYAESVAQLVPAVNTIAFTLQRAAVVSAR
ncbi:MAG TPA: low molecular weight phosphatase family protein [Microbacteriaceae bacterium]